MPRMKQEAFLVDRAEEDEGAVAKTLQNSNLPVGEEHTLRGVTLRISFVRHPQIGPAHAIAPGDQAPERFAVAALAADRDPADAGLGQIGRASCRERVWGGRVG